MKTVMMTDGYLDDDSESDGGDDNSGNVSDGHMSVDNGNDSNTDGHMSVDGGNSIESDGETRQQQVGGGRGSRCQGRGRGRGHG